MNIFLGLINGPYVDFQKNSLSPMPRWGPAEPENQIGRYAHLRTTDYNEMAGDLANGNGEKALNGKGGFDNLAHIDERL